MKDEWRKKRDGHYMRTIDPEGDVRVDAVELVDYNDDRVVTISCSGYPVITFTFNQGGFEHECLIPIGYETPQAQAMIAFMKHVEGIEEKEYEAYVRAIKPEVMSSGEGMIGMERFMACMESGGDGHETLGFIEELVDLLNDDWSKRTNNGELPDGLHEPPDVSPKYKDDDHVVLMADYPESGEPEQRATIISYDKQSKAYMVRVIPEDRVDNDYDGLTEIAEEGIKGFNPEFGALTIKN